MTDRSKQNALRAIPPIDELLARPEMIEGREAHPHFPWTRVLRETVEGFRSRPTLPAGPARADRESVGAWIAGEVIARVEALRGEGQKRVINGTGVVLHTNLGRAVLGTPTVQAVAEAMAHYVSLEVDLETGKRSKRAAVLNDLAALATGAQAAMVVNNNAAAVYLVVNSYSPPGRVIVSRGELVEIGGSFRLPEILRHAAIEVVEVGTTNRTYADDYRKVVRGGDIILKVHKSNYAIEGFAHEATHAELAVVARDTGSHLVHDLGSGAVFDYRSAGVGDEPRVVEILDDGVDCVTMSGDKLLGGVQAGILAGRRDFLEPIKQNPLRRAMRVDKVTIAALQSVLRCYLFETDPTTAVPVLGQVTSSVESLETRARSIVSRLSRAVREGWDVTAVGDDAVVGGGSLSTEKVPSTAVCIRCADEKAAVALAKSLRLHSLPVMARIKAAEVRVNLRSVIPYEDDALAAALDTVLSRAKR